MLDETEANGRSVARWVRAELTDYLACGIVRHGFTLLRCLGWRTSRLVAFSCKGRAFCPSCCGRRMNSTAAHLADRVFPRVPVRCCQATTMASRCPIAQWKCRRPGPARPGW